MSRRSTALMVVAGLLVLPLASCKQDKGPDIPPPAPSTAKPGAKTLTAVDPHGAERTIHTEPGVAGGIIEDTVTATAKVTAVDPAKRRVTLKGDEGEATFTAGPEVKNLDQVKVGDTLTATLNRRLIVYVRGIREDATATYAAAVASAPKGAKPGAIVGESYEVVANVTAIDPAKRTATLKFVDGKSSVVNVRPDVDMDRYKVGDTVVIRVTTTLGLLVASK